MSLKAVMDGENVEFVSFDVSETLAAVLTEQRAKLDTIDSKETGKQRYQAARAAGCLPGVAGGVGDRAMKSNQIFIPRKGVVQTKDRVRISTFKVTIAGAVDGTVRGVLFTRDEDGDWSGALEIDKPEAMSAAA